MKKFRFQIQKNIDFDVFDIDRNKARKSLIDNPDLYQKELLTSSTWISEAIEIKDETRF